MAQYVEAFKIAQEILNIFRENSSFSVTNLLRRCARVAELLKLDDILWINNELKGYPDEDVPPYRIIDVKCHYSWDGELPSSIGSDRNRKEQFYQKWTEKIVIKESSIILESWTGKAHSIELRSGTKYGVNVREIANVYKEQYWEIKHRIADKIREFISNIEIELSEKIPSKEQEIKIIAFVSASFSEEVDYIITWFLKNYQVF